ncbi:MAG: DNA adenine methylase, partial [Candidatus Baldrarchaeia archaeon]
MTIELQYPDINSKDAFQSVIRFWGRVPSIVASQILRTLADKYFDGSLNGRIVLDPFGGSGSLIFEAARLGADCIYSDVNPVFTFIASTLVKPVKEEILKRFFEVLRQRLLSKRYPVYLSEKLVHISYWDLYSIRIEGEEFFVYKTVVDPIIFLRGEWSERTYRDLLSRSGFVYKLAATIYYKFKDRREYRYSRLREEVLRENSDKLSSVKLNFTKALRLLERLGLLFTKFYPSAVFYGKLEGDGFRVL